MRCAQFKDIHIFSTDALGVIHIVKSAIPNSKRRHAIRETWGAVKAWGDIRQEVVFIIGRTLDKDEHKMLLEESKTFGDILQFNLMDNAT